MSKHRFSTGLTETSSRKVFHDGCAKRDIFSQQILNKNILCLAHCALNRSFTVFTISVLFIVVLKVYIGGLIVMTLSVLEKHSFLS